MPEDPFGDLQKWARSGEAVEMTNIPDCDICQDGTKARYDCRLPKLSAHGWGYVCEDHFRQYGPGQLGTGHGQRLFGR